MFNPFSEIPPVTVEKIVEEDTRPLNNPSVLSRVPADRVWMLSLQNYSKTSAEFLCEFIVGYCQDQFGAVSVNVEIPITEYYTNNIRKFGSWIG